MGKACCLSLPFSHISASLSWKQQSAAPPRIPESALTVGAAFRLPDQDCPTSKPLPRANRHVGRFRHQAAPDPKRDKAQPPRAVPKSAGFSVFLPVSCRSARPATSPKVRQHSRAPSIVCIFPVQSVVLIEAPNASAQLSFSRASAALAKWPQWREFPRTSAHNGHLIRKGCRPRRYLAKVLLSARRRSPINAPERSFMRRSWHPHWRRATSKPRLAHRMP